MSTYISKKVLSEILEKTNASNGMFISSAYKNCLKNLLDLFGNIYYIDKNNNSIKLKCIHANQERAIARITTGDNITLPLITISETSTMNDDDRRRYNPTLVHDSYWDNDKQRAIRILTLPPRPITISYSINIWTKYKQDLDQIRGSIFLLFNPDIELNIKENFFTKAFIQDESDASEITANDTQDRILRKSINIFVETYIPNPKFLYTSTGKIEQMKYEIDTIPNNKFNILSEGFTLSSF
jgi:hypothetical protein